MGLFLNGLNTQLQYQLKTLGLLVLICLVCFGCNSPDAPWCLMSAGEHSEFVSSYPGAQFFEVEIHDHVDVQVELWDSAAVEIRWQGPSNLLAHRQEWVSEQRLTLGWEDRCEWARNLSHHPRILMRTHEIPAFVLRGQGRFEITALDSTQSLKLDAWAFAGEIRCNVHLDTCSVRLHSGVALTEITGQVNTFEGYASGLSHLDASLCSSRQAHINQSGHPVLRFQTLDYAYVQIESSGDVNGGEEPAEWELRSMGSGQLIWD